METLGTGASGLLRKAHEYALLAEFVTEPEARQINRRMAQEYLDLAQQVIEEEFPPFLAGFSWKRRLQAVRS
jgi:hypothetical protein